jgi:import receptor subunit TOM20
MNEIPAALSFYRALRVYPSPVELIMSSCTSGVLRFVLLLITRHELCHNHTVYQKTVPPSIFALLMELTSLDVSSGKTAPTGPSGSLADLDDEEKEPTMIEASVNDTATGDRPEQQPQRCSFER